MSTIVSNDVLMLAFGLPGHGEWLILLLLGLLLFGRRLPEVGRSIGRSIVEFKRGIKGIESDIEDESSRPGNTPERIEETSAQSLPSQHSEPAEADLKPAAAQQSETVASATPRSGEDEPAA